MAGLLDNQFANMTMADKLKTLGSGLLGSGSLFFRHPISYVEHALYPEQLKVQLSKDLGNERTNRSPLDVAINYGGGYQFGTIPSVTLDEADKLAKAWQLRDYMMAKNPHLEQDAWKDYQENMAGVRAAIEAKRTGNVVEKDKIYKEAAKYGKLYK
jgi:hypothetical protein